MKKNPNRKYKSFPFKSNNNRNIICNGSELKLVNSRMLKYEWIIEYYKCKNCRKGKRYKNIHNCTFSAKVKYKLGTTPTHLLILKDHSKECPNKISVFDNKNLPKKSNDNNNIDIIFNDQLLERLNIIGEANLSVQIQKY